MVRKTSKKAPAVQLDAFPERVQMARVSFTLPPAELEAFEQARVGVIRQGKTADQVDVAAAHMWRACLKAFLALPAKKRAALVWGVEPGKVGNPGAASS